MNFSGLTTAQIRAMYTDTPVESIAQMLHNICKTPKMKPHVDFNCGGNSTRALH